MSNNYIDFCTYKCIFFIFIFIPIHMSMSRRMSLVRCQRLWLFNPCLAGLRTTTMPSRVPSSLWLSTLQQSPQLLHTFCSRLGEYTYCLNSDRRYKEVLCDSMDYTVHGILQARIPEWVAYPFCRGSSQPRNWTRVSCIAGGFFTKWAIREAQGLNIWR